MTVSVHRSETVTVILSETDKFPKGTLTVILSETVIVILSETDNGYLSY